MGSCSQFSLAFATPSSPIYRGHPSSCQCMEARPRAGVYYLWPDPEVTSLYLRPPRGIFSVEWGALPPSLELLNAIPTCGLCLGTCQVPAAWQSVYPSFPPLFLSFWVLLAPGDSTFTFQEFFWSPLPSCLWLRNDLAGQ